MRADDGIRNRRENLHQAIVWSWSDVSDSLWVQAIVDTVEKVVARYATDKQTPST